MQSALCGLRNRMENDMTLWSLRTNPARGNHFVAERKVTNETAQQWLAIFRADEPKVLFLVSKSKPKTK
jgi:hypothetical protein